MQHFSEQKLGKSVSSRRDVLKNGLALATTSAALGIAIPAIAQSAQTDLNWMATGEGSPVVFVHGAGGNASVWFQQIAAFLPDHRAIAYDLRGYGKSPDPASSFGPAELTADALGVLDAAEAEKSVMVCQSLEGWTGLRVALEAPERLRGLVLCNTMAGVGFPPALQALGTAAASVGGDVPSLALTETFKMERPDLAHLYQSIGASSRPNNPEVAQRFVSTGLVPPDRLSNIDTPVLIIAGEQDPIWPPEVLEPIAQMIPNCRFEVIAGAGYSPYFEMPDAFNALVEEFVGTLD